MSQVSESKDLKRKRRWRFDGRRSDGKRTQRFFATKEDALQFKRKFDAEKDGFIFGGDVIAAVTASRVSRPDVEIGSALEEYLSVVMPKKAPRTQEVEAGYLNKFYQWLYDRKVYYVDDLRLEHLEMYQTVLSKNLAAATVNRTFNAVKHFVGKCHDWGMIEANVGEKLERLSEDSTEYEIWSDDDFRRIALAVPPHMSDFLWGLSLTGARPGQLGDLRFGKIDFEQRSYEIKSKKGGRWRTIRLPAPSPFLALVSRRREQARFDGRASDDCLVFTTRRGGRVTHRALNTAVRRAREKLKIKKRLCPYGLRHTFGTRLNSVGANLRAIAALLGHAQVATTERYTRNVDETLRRLVDTAPAALKTDSVTKNGDL